VDRRGEEGAQEEEVVRFQTLPAEEYASGGLNARKRRLSLAPSPANTLTEKCVCVCVGGMLSRLLMVLYRNDLNTL